MPLEIIKDMNSRLSPNERGEPGVCMVEKGKPEAGMVEQGKPGVGTLDRSELGIGVVQLRTGERGTKMEAVGCPGGLAADAVWVLSPLGRVSDG